MNTEKTILSTRVLIRRELMEALNAAIGRVSLSNAVNTALIIATRYPDEAREEAARIAGVNRNGNASH